MICPNCRRLEEENARLKKLLASHGIVWEEPLVAELEAAPAESVPHSCRALNIPAALEISHSGNGAHVWIFFADPVSAREARLIGEGFDHGLLHF